MTDDRLDALEAEIERELPPLLRELLKACAGGRPEKPFFESEKHGSEAVIGHILMVEGRVIYRILHEPQGEARRMVADSLEELLTGLQDCPF